MTSRKSQSERLGEIRVLVDECFSSSAKPPSYNFWRFPQAAGSNSRSYRVTEAGVLIVMPWYIADRLGISHSYARHLLHVMARQGLVSLSRKDCYAPLVARFEKGASHDS